MQRGSPSTSDSVDSPTISTRSPNTANTCLQQNRRFLQPKKKAPARIKITDPLSKQNCQIICETKIPFTNPPTTTANERPNHGKFLTRKGFVPLDRSVKQQRSLESRKRRVGTLDPTPGIRQPDDEGVSVGDRHLMPLVLFYIREWKEAKLRERSKRD